MSDYRWNQPELAAAYDRDAIEAHPHYVEVQDAVLEVVSAHAPEFRDGLIVDLGGGSGRLMERVLERFSEARGIVVDQSEAFLELARGRLAQFGGRGATLHARLQDAWSVRLPSAPFAIVSMSAIHHLDPAEKQRCYAQARAALAHGGVFVNGDEVRPENDAEYREQCRRWGAHMQRLIDEERVSPPMRDALRAWQTRNINHADLPRKSGDDCLETAAVQLGYLASVGFEEVRAAWGQDLWGVLIGVRPRA